MSYTNGLDKPDLYFNTVTYTGTGSSQNISVGFQTDWTWIKQRSGTENHNIFDTVRTATKRISSNRTNAEDTQAQQLTAFGSDGFTVGTDAGTNFNGGTYASWNWKAGTSFTNDASSTGIGSRDSVGSFNNDAGFSITTLTTAGSGADTYKHGLNATPSLMIAKTRSSANGWFVYHKDIGNTKFLRLETTGAETTNTMWNNTSPTSSVFSLNADNIGSSVTVVVYSFCEKKGYSKFGSYTGNGNADGTFVYTGFKPAFIMVKDYTGVGNNWFIWDNKRDGYNVINRYLRPNLSNAEGYYEAIDILSNGFKNRNISGSANGSGTGYIYMAFAENPFTTSTGIPTTAR